MERTIILGYGGGCAQARLNLGNDGWTVETRLAQANGEFDRKCLDFQQVAGPFETVMGAFKWMCENELRLATE